jgi:hypothetical protein
VNTADIANCTSVIVYWVLGLFTVLVAAAFIMAIALLREK